MPHSGAACRPRPQIPLRRRTARVRHPVNCPARPNSDGAIRERKSPRRASTPPPRCDHLWHPAERGDQGGHGAARSVPRLADDDGLVVESSPPLAGVGQCIVIRDCVLAQGGASGMATRSMAASRPLRVGPRRCAFPGGSGQAWIGTSSRRPPPGGVPVGHLPLKRECQNTVLYLPVVVRLPAPVRPGFPGGKSCHG